MPKMIFANLPVTDRPATTRFYEAIGCVKNRQFSEDNAAADWIHRRHQRHADVLRSLGPGDADRRPARRLQGHPDGRPKLVATHRVYALEFQGHGHATDTDRSPARTSPPTSR
jgi:hypothetical protein